MRVIWFLSIDDNIMCISAMFANHSSYCFVVGVGVCCRRRESDNGLGLSFYNVIWVKYPWMCA